MFPFKFVDEGWNWRRRKLSVDVANNERQDEKTYRGNWGNIIVATRVKCKWKGWLGMVSAFVAFGNGNFISSSSEDVVPSS